MEALGELTFTSFPSFLHSASQGIRFSISATVLATNLTLFASSPTCSLANSVVCWWKVSQEGSLSGATQHIKRPANKKSTLQHVPQLNAKGRRIKPLANSIPQTPQERGKETKRPFHPLHVNKKKPPQSNQTTKMRHLIPNISLSLYVTQLTL